MVDHKPKLLFAFGNHAGRGNFGFDIPAETGFFRKTIVPYSQDAMKHGRPLRIFFESQLALDYVLGSEVRPEGNGEFKLVVVEGYYLKYSFSDLQLTLATSNHLTHQDSGQLRYSTYQSEPVFGSPVNVGGFAYWGFESRVIDIANGMNQYLTFENEQTTKEVLIAELNVLDAYRNLANYLRNKTGSPSFVVSPLFGNQLTMNYEFNSMDFWPACKVGSLDSEFTALVAKAFGAYAEYQFLRDTLFYGQIYQAAKNNPEESHAVARGIGHVPLVALVDKNIFDVIVKTSSKRRPQSFFSDAVSEAFEMQDPKKVDYQRYAEMFARQIRLGAELDLSISERIIIALRSAIDPLFIDRATYGLVKY